jgi:hypothetical protein
VWDASNQEQHGTLVATMIDRDTVISVHEAGHAIVARALALRCGGASVVDGRGSAQYEDEVDGSLAVIVAHLAGAAAESVLIGRIADGLRGDQQAIAAACDARGMSQDALDRLWHTACALVRAHEVDIRCVAVELQRRRSLTGAEIDALAWPRR